MGPATPSRLALHEASWSGTHVPPDTSGRSEPLAASARLPRPLTRCGVIPSRINAGAFMRPQTPAPLRGLAAPHRRLRYEKVRDGTLDAPADTSQAQRMIQPRRGGAGLQANACCLRRLAAYEFPT